MFKITNFSVWSRSSLEPPIFAWSRRGLNFVESEVDFGLSEPESPKKVAAPQHCTKI